MYLFLLQRHITKQNHSPKFSFKWLCQRDRLYNWHNQPLLWSWLLAFHIATQRECRRGLSEASKLSQRKRLSTRVERGDLGRTAAVFVNLWSGIPGLLIRKSLAHFDLYSLLQSHCWAIIWVAWGRIMFNSASWSCIWNAINWLLLVVN